MNWWLAALKKYAVFSGRARRKEFWFFLLFSVILAIVAMILDNVLGIAIEGLGYGPIYLWFIFIVLIPIVGGIWLWVLVCLDSMPGENQY